jgi:chaperone required for assembly of F1-ATPase
MIERTRQAGVGDPGFREPQTRKALPKRFYKEVSVGSESGRYRILLDGRPVRAPGGTLLAVPSARLAEAVADEWRAQGAVIDPATMPLTRILNSALEGVAGREAEVAADILKYAGSDLLCYRADGPGELARRQSRRWDPVIEWARAELGCRFALAEGVMPVTQSDVTLARFSQAIDGRDALALAALHVMTTLLGSALLAVAHARGVMTRDAAWDAAHVDEDYQIEQWGEDAEAAQRRRSRRCEFDAASLIVELLSAC